MAHIKESRTFNYSRNNICLNRFFLLFYVHPSNLTIFAYIKESIGFLLIEFIRIFKDSICLYPTRYQTKNLNVFMIFQSWLFPDGKNGREDKDRTVLQTVFFLRFFRCVVDDRWFDRSYRKRSWFSANDITVW